MPSTNSFCTACPTNCNPLILPALAVNQTCASTSDLKKSQISYIVMLPNGAAYPTDWKLASAWAGIIDNTSIDNTKAKIFTVTGGISSPAITRVDFPLNASAVSSREYTMTLTRQKLDDSDYAFFRALQCGAQNFDFFYSSLSGYLYGGANGIAPSEINVSFPKGAGKTDTDSVVIEIKWTACGEADRVLLSLL